MAYLHTSDDRWYVMARTRFVGALVRTQLALLWYYLALGVAIGLWLWVVRTAWVRHRPPRSNWTVGAGLGGLWLALVATVLLHALAFHLDSFWSVRNFLEDRYGLVIRYSSLESAQWVARFGKWTLLGVTAVASVRLLADWVAGRRNRMLLRRAAWLVPIASIGAVAAAAWWPKTHAAPAPASEAHPRDRLPNVIILGCDSLRADHLGCYGYRDKTGRDTSPNIDALAAEGVLIEDLFSVSGSTTDSWFSMLSGRWPHEHGIRTIFPTRQMAGAAGHVPTLVRQAADRGYRTVVLGDWAACSFDSVDHGFQQRRCDPDMTFPDYIGRVTEKTHVWVSAAMMNPLCRWLRLGFGGDLNRNTYQDVLAQLEAELERSRETGQPLFLLAFLSVAHMPYQIYEGFPVRFGEPGYQGPHERAMDISLNDLFKRGAHTTIGSARQRIVDLYDTTIWVFDQIVGRAIEQLRKRDMLDDAVVVIVSDHGEDFFEPNVEASHGKYLVAGPQSYHIPLIFRAPARLTPARVPHRLRTIDVAPTFAELLGLGPLEGATGRSFLPQMTATPEELDAMPDDRVCFFETGFLWDCPIVYPPDDPHRGYASMSEMVEPDPAWNYSMVIPEAKYPLVMRAKDLAILKGDWKLVYVAQRRRPELRLYNVADDPHCQRPLPRSDGPFDELARELHGWITADARRDFYLPEDMTPAEFDALFLGE